MLNLLHNHITELGVTPEDTIIAAVSGGVDSMVMLHLLVEGGYKVEVAHCNFNLRGEESNADEAFVKSECEKLGVKLHTHSFDTLEYAVTKGKSIQIAARELRYDWFEKLRAQLNAAYIATAHHLTDSIETILINQIRGTGLAGYHGIPAKQGHIIRPMMFATREQIEAYAKANTVAFREDSSNNSDKYMRNKIRHHILPVLKELNADIEHTFAKNAALIRDYEKLVKQTHKKRFSKVAVEDGDTIYIDIFSLKNLKPLNVLLFEYLRKFNFKMNVVEDIVAGMEGESGRIYESKTHRITKDREQLILERIPTANFSEITIQADTKQVQTPFGNLTIERINSAHIEIERNPNKAYLDAAKLEYPLTLRKWQAGDYFQPLGMKGKKKLSDFLIDQKVPVNEKEKVMVLTAGKQVLWVVGHRLDDRMKLSKESEEVVLISVS